MEAIEVLGIVILIAMCLLPDDMVYDARKKKSSRQRHWAPSRLPDDGRKKDRVD